MSIGVLGTVNAHPVRRTVRAAVRAAAAALFLVAAASLVPSDDAYYRLENAWSHVGPLASASQHVRSAPSTASSIIMEAFQSRSLVVEGVEIDLRHAVNPTENVEEASFFSREMGEDRRYWIYLPPGYDDSTLRYPTLYLLHGMSQGHRWWSEVARIDRIATAMIDSGKVRPFIIVMPNGNRVEQDVSTTGLYDDHCRTGLDVLARALKALGDRLTGLRIYKVSCDADFGNYIVNEVVKDVDSSYRTDGERYIGGFSVGGRGALQLSVANGGVFDGGFGLSGSYDFLRKAMRNKDQRGLYGELGTFLFHKDLAGLGVEHLYCTYDGTHSDMAWVAAMPQALRYLLGTEDAPRQDRGDALSCSAR